MSKWPARYAKENLLIHGYNALNSNIDINDRKCIEDYEYIFDERVAIMEFDGEVIDDYVDLYATHMMSYVAF